MKKFISLLLATLTTCIFVLGMSGCGGASKSAVVGVWECNIENPFKGSYLYVYDDGTGDIYLPSDTGHCNNFEWSIDGEQFVIQEATKHTIDGNYMYDKQGKLAYTKVSNNTSIDINA